MATNLDLPDLIPLARNIKNYHMGDTYGFPAARGELDIGKIGDCVVPQTLEYNVKELHKFLSMRRIIRCHLMLSSTVSI